MSKPLAFGVLLLGSSLAQAYQAGELREDCQIAESMLAQQTSLTPYDSLRGTRCISYLAGFADGYAVADYLGSKVGLQIGAFCLPKEENLPPRMVRALLAQFDRMPPQIRQSTAEIAAAALARSFPCNEKLETK